LPGPTRLADEVEKFLLGIPTLAWDEAAADEFGEVRAAFERAGTPIGSMDTMIAAHAKAVGATLVTNHLKHFWFVKGLTLNNWLE
jgi:tRNA(fMet)-specific endonuclease VapC